MRSRHEGWRIVVATALGAGALLGVLLVGGPPAAGAPGATQTPDALQEPPPGTLPPAPPEEALPRIIRVVCTDHICGHCDGKCHKESGHVAVDKKGHCACTPTEGSALDRATRDAYAKNQPK
jgi:hypothetical protein